jgi:hypothetical protein
MCLKIQCTNVLQILAFGMYSVGDTHVGRTVQKKANFKNDEPDDVPVDLRQSRKRLGDPLGPKTRFKNRSSKHVLYVTVDL